MRPRKWVAFDADKWWVGGVNDPSLWTLLAGYGLLAWAAGRLDAALTRWRDAPFTIREPLLRGALWGYGAAVLVLAALLAPGEAAPPFIYFQF